MSWAGILLLALKSVAGVVEYLSRQRLLDAGKTEAINKSLEQLVKNLQRATHASEEVTNNPDGEFANRLRDKYTRSDE